MSDAKTTIERFDIIRSKDRYYCNPYLCEMGNMGGALLYHDAPYRNSTVKIDPKGILNPGKMFEGKDS